MRAGQPKGLKEFGRLQKDTKTDELMMEDLGKYVIKNITGRTYWKSCSLQEGMGHRKRHDGIFIQLSFMQMSMGSQRARI